MCGSTPLARGRYRHIALIAETAADARDVMVGDGKEPSNPNAGSGLLQVHPKEFCPRYEPSKRRLTWPNGAAATLYNAVEPEQLRGPQHDGAWCDEIFKWRYQQETWDQLQFGLRTGSDPRVVITSTPRPTPLIKFFLKDKHTHVTRGRTFDNAGNLATSFLTSIRNRYEGTTLGRQELDAEVLEGIGGALWRMSNIDANRIKLKDLPELSRIVVAIDPSVSSQENSDETGIVVAGIDSLGHGYILDDASGVMSPKEWATTAVALYRDRRADRIVAERNNGGDMVEETIRSAGENVSYRSVWASKGKFIRAEPVSALYEQNKIHHVGCFPQLEDQMCSFVVDFDRKGMGTSPDRMDALVWALTDLMVDVDDREPAFFGV